jgi:hypothetical protein
MTGPAGAFALDWVKRSGKVIAAWAEASHRSNSAVTLYESLSKLPTIELARRGMTRSDVNRRIFVYLTGD